MPESSHSFRNSRRSSSGATGGPISGFASDTSLRSSRRATYGSRSGLWRTVLWWALAAVAAFVLLEAVPSHAAPADSGAAVAGQSTAPPIQKR